MKYLFIISFLFITTAFAEETPGTTIVVPFGTGGVLRSNLDGVQILVPDVKKSEQPGRSAETQPQSSSPGMKPFENRGVVPFGEQAAATGPGIDLPQCICR